MTTLEMTDEQKAKMRQDIKDLRIVMNGTIQQIRDRYNWN